MGGATYTIKALYTTASSFVIVFDGLTGAEAKTGLMGLTVIADGRSYLINTATTSLELLYWQYPPSFTDEQKVALSLVEPIKVQ